MARLPLVVLPDGQPVFPEDLADMARVGVGSLVLLLVAFGFLTVLFLVGAP